MLGFGKVVINPIRTAIESEILFLSKFIAVPMFDKLINYLLLKWLVLFSVVCVYK